MGEQQRQEQQDVFCPLVGPEGLEDRLGKGPAIFKALNSMNVV